jgi:hypothetical protein
VEDSCAVCQCTAINRNTGTVEKEERRWCCRRPGKPACAPHGKSRRRVYYQIVLICSIRRGLTSVSLVGPNPPAGERVPGQAPLVAEISVGRAPQICQRTRRSLITITFSDTCRSMREHPMVITESGVGKILTLICRSCVCRRLGKVGDLIF